MHSKVFSYIITFPFEQLGWGLRRLSLHSSAGNIFAIIIYLLICFTPCLLCWRLRKAKKNLKTDFFLPVLSVMLLAVVYYMINPGLLHSNVSGAGKILLGSTFYSVFFGYVTLRILEKCSLSDEKRLKVELRALFAAIIFLFFYIILMECLENLLISIQSLKDAASYPDSLLTLNYVFLILQYINNIIPYALAIFILIAAIRTLNALLSDRYSDKSAAAAEKLSALCKYSLIITVLSSMIFNVLQLLFHKNLYQINVTVTVPVSSVAFILAVLLTAKYIRENQKLKQDNDLFI